MFINATDVDGVYSEDPKRSKYAKKIGKKLHVSLLKSMIKKSSSRQDLMN